MRTKKNEETPTNCTICNADLVNINDETRVDITTALTGEAGGVTATMVVIILTNKRLVFYADESSSGVGGGLLGAVIEGAVNAAVNAFVKSPKYNEILLTNIKSLDETVKGLFKNRVEVIIHTKGEETEETYKMTIRKKEMEKWRSTLLQYANIEKPSDEWNSSF